MPVPDEDVQMDAEPVPAVPDANAAPAVVPDQEVQLVLWFGLFRMVTIPEDPPSALIHAHNIVHNSPIMTSCGAPSRTKWLKRAFVIANRIASRTSN
jgi:hypothetical protein